jgi:hypothetical protein
MLRKATNVAFIKDYLKLTGVSRKPLSKYLH